MRESHSDEGTYTVVLYINTCMYFVICDTADGEGMLIWGEGGDCKCAREEYCNVVMRTVYSSMISLPY